MAPSCWKILYLISVSTSAFQKNDRYSDVGVHNNTNEIMTTTATSTAIIIEQDTEEQEDIPNLFQYLLPFTSFEETTSSSSSSLSSSYSQLQLSWNQNVFQGWVKQPSPCCAAAAVAGAWNAIHHYSRNHSSALHHQDILKIYIMIIEEKILKKIHTFHRKLGYYSSPLPSNSVKQSEETERFWEQFNEGCQVHYQRQLGGKKETLITKKIMEKVLRGMIKELLIQLVREERDGIIVKDWKEVLDEVELFDFPSTGKKNSSNNNSNNHDNNYSSSNKITQSFVYCMAELYEQENKSLFRETVIEENTESEKIKEEKKGMEDDGKDASAEDDEEILDQEDEEGDGDDDANEGKSSSVLIVIDNGKSKSSKKKWDWRKDLLDIIKAKSGIIKLQQAKPSTAYIGNWGIIESVDYLAQQYQYGDQLTARIFMGKKKLAKSKIDFPLLRKDKDEVIQSQWEGLKAVFSRPNHLLLFHLKNHYALVFAMRDWYDCNEKKYYRQLLSARKGQRPTAWIDFHDVREVLLSWEGYKMMLIVSTLENFYYVEKTEIGKRK